MTKLYQNIKSLCKATKISVSELERRLKIPPNTITGWRKNMPSCERAQLIADYFGVSLDFLVGNCNNPLSHIEQFNESTTKLIEISEKLKLSNEEAELITDFIVLLRKHRDKPFRN